MERLRLPHRGWETSRQSASIREETMEQYPWVRVVSSDWEYTERIGS